MKIKLVLGLILAVVAVIFIVQNVTVVEVRFLFWSLNLSRALLMLLILAIGLVVGWLLHGYAAHRRRKSLPAK